MTRGDAEAFARRWIDAWNRRDIDAVVAHFAPDARFTSPRALERTGAATVAGRDALHAYWSATRRLRALRFTLDRIVWDGERRELVILYTNEAGPRPTRAMEVLTFGPGARAVAGEAMYGAPV